MLLHFLMRTGYDSAVSVVHISVCNAFVDPIFICYAMVYLTHPSTKAKDYSQSKPFPMV